MRKILFILLLPASLLAGCDSSLYEGISNKNTDEAITDEMDFAYITGNCQKVVSYYESLKNSGVTLNVRESSIYSNAILACSGFDIMNGIDSILNSGNGDIYGSISSIMGTDNINSGNIDELKDQYKQILENCDSMPKPLPASMVNVCGMTAASDTLLDVADIILNSGAGVDNIELTEEGIQNAINSVDDPKKIEDAIKNDPNLIPDLNNKVDYIDEVSDSLGVSNGFMDDMKDPATGEITEGSLVDFINGFGGAK